ncbi:AMP-binding protein [Piscinibacter sakaiensis]|uniref:AMP-binding protein n=1 Tax=Piscinibacter sakaiensis TaxID=1547922 RepID=UPI003AAE6A13
MNLRSFTLHDQIQRNARLYGQRTAFVCDGHSVSHAQYAASAARMAAGLHAAGVVAGERVAILSHNSLAYLDLLGAAALLGAIIVPINWRLSADEVTFVLADTTPQVLIASPDLQPLVAAADLSTMRLFSTAADGAPWRALSGLYADGPPPAPAAINDDAGLAIVHTAAVGGRPRGALLSHRGLLAAAAKSVHVWSLTTADVGVGVLPLFHLAGIGLTLALLAAGGSTVVLPRFDPAAVVGVIEEQHGSVMGSFPPMLAAVLDAAAASGSALSTLRVVTGIDAPETLARFAEVQPGADFWVAYGQTETSGSISTSRYSDRPGSAGMPVEQHSLAIVDDEDQPVADGTIGEIVVRGPMVFSGYWNCEADNTFTFRGGWHHTGDMGRLDADGYLWYVGRSAAKELIKPGGENVYPAEVERALLEHPAVAEAVVFGVPDTQWGEAVKAVCVLAAGQQLVAEKLIEFVGQRIARYKKPKQVVFVASLPRTAAGAVDRAAVKAAHTGA